MNTIGLLLSFVVSLSSYGVRVVTLASQNVFEVYPFFVLCGTI